MCGHGDDADGGDIERELGGCRWGRGRRGGNKCSSAPGKTDACIMVQQAQGSEAGWQPWLRLRLRLQLQPRW